MDLRYEKVEGGGGICFRTKKEEEMDIFPSFLGQIVTLYFHLRNSCFSSAARIIVSRKFPRNFRRRKGKEKGKRDVLTFPPCGHGKKGKKEKNSNWNLFRFVV